MISSSSLNISCSCKACSTFLRPTVSASQPYLLSFFSLPSTSTSDSTLKKKKPLPTPFWVDKLSLSAYDVTTITPATSTPPFQIPLGLNTSSLRMASEEAEKSQTTRSAFPKTPGTLRCTHGDCRTRIPVALSLPGVGSLGIKSLLCEEHWEDVFYDAEEDIVEAPSSEKEPKMMMAETTAFWSSESGIIGAESGVRGGGRASTKILPALARRASSTASWSSVASMDGSEPSRSGHLGFEWAARAFESKLCW